jgi:hypothetical protein
VSFGVLGASRDPSGIRHVAHKKAPAKPALFEFLKLVDA